MAGSCQCSGTNWLCVRTFRNIIRKLLSKHTPSHPLEPQCSYDPVEGLTLAPDTDPLEKIKELEDQICELQFVRYLLTFTLYIASLKSQLYSRPTISTPPQPSTSIAPSGNESIATMTMPTTLVNVISAHNSPETRFQSTSQSPELHTIHVKTIESDPFLDVLFLGWNPDLPDPVSLNH